MILYTATVNGSNNMKYISILIALMIHVNAYAGVDLQHRQRQISLLEEYERNFNLVRIDQCLGFPINSMYRAPNPNDDNCGDKVISISFFLGGIYN